MGALVTSGNKVEQDAPNKELSVMTPHELEVLPSARQTLHDMNSLLNERQVAVPEWAMVKKNVEEFRRVHGRKYNIVSPLNDNGWRGFASLAVGSASALTAGLLSGGIALAQNELPDDFVPILIGLLSSSALLLPGAVKGVMDIYNGGGTSMESQPIRKFLVSLFRSKKKKAILFKRVQDRELYFLAVEARKTLARKMLSDLENEGYLEVLTKFRSHDDHYEKNVYTLALNGETGLIEYRQKEEIESSEEVATQKSLSSTELNQKSIVELISDLK